MREPERLLDSLKARLPAQRIEERVPFSAREIRIPGAHRSVKAIERAAVSPTVRRYRRPRQPVTEDGSDLGLARDPRRDRPVWTLANMSEEERAPHELAVYPDWLAFARIRSWRRGRRSVENTTC
jgi:hypothetical protein